MIASFKSSLHRNWGQKVGNLLFVLIILVLVFAVVAPFLWMFISSVSNPRALAQRPPEWIPSEITFDRYKALFSIGDSDVSLPVAPERFQSALMTSLVVSTSTTLVSLLAGALAAYAFVRLNVPGRKFLLMAILAAQMLPVIVIIIPLFIVMQRLGLLDTHLGLILVYTGYLLPVVVWILVSYFETIPLDMEEAAMIDGCSRFQTLYRVVLPLAGPGMVAVAVFTFLSSWNEFFMALIFSGSNAKTITVTITEFTTQAGIDLGLMSTGGVIGSVPPLILAFVLHRHIVEGLTSGGVKA